MQKLQRLIMNDSIILKSGKSIYANRGLVSCVKTERGWELGEGYDGDIYLTEYVEGQEDYQPAYTKSELVELARIMISRWIVFIADVLDGEVPCK